jgi:hypothetical protein
MWNSYWVMSWKSKGTRPLFTVTAFESKDCSIEY